MKHNNLYAKLSQGGLRVLLTFSVISYFGIVKAESIIPGEYLIEGGGGYLDIKPSKVKHYPFHISTVGANFHTCELEGVIEDSRAVLEGLDEDTVCTVEFSPSHGSIKVSGNYYECRGYCGLRAGFFGTYILPTAQCTQSGIEKSQQQFANLYRAKSYAKALSKLTPVLTECSETLHWIDSGNIRNDIAITQYHLGRLEECKKTLGPVLEDAYGNEDELRENLAPSDFDVFLPIAKAAWHNKKLCDGSVKQKN